MLDWLNKVGVPRLKKLPEFLGMGADSYKVIEVKDGMFTLQVCPNGSYGYLYMGCWQYYPPDCQYELKNCPTYTFWSMEIQEKANKLAAKAKWSGTNPPPPIGAWVKLKCNGVWYGHVVGYFVESGFMGIEVDCHRRPAWHQKQNPGKRLCYFFGLDVVESRSKVA